MAEASKEFEFCGVNHLALVCKDMARTVEFYRDILGMPLTKTIDLPGNRGQHFFFDIGNGGIHRLGIHRPLAQGQFQTGPEFFPVKLSPGAVFLDHLGQADFRPLVGCEPLVAFDATPTTTDEIRLLVETGINDRGIRSSAEGAFHGIERLAAEATGTGPAASWART